MAGLNPAEIDQAVALVGKLAQRGLTIVFVEHVMRATMAVANHIVVLDHGQKIAEGNPKEVVANTEVISRIWEPATRTPSRLETPCVSAIRGHQGYGSVPAVRDLSIAVGEGEAVGLLGANGAGKSTTLRAISGLVRGPRGRLPLWKKHRRASAIQNR